MARCTCRIRRRAGSGASGTARSEPIAYRHLSGALGLALASGVALGQSPTPATPAAPAADATATGQKLYARHCLSCPPVRRLWRAQHAAGHQGRRLGQG
jgi:hypothetical protein